MPMISHAFPLANRHKPRRSGMSIATTPREFILFVFSGAVVGRSHWPEPFANANLVVRINLSWRRAAENKKNRVGAAGFYRRATPTGFKRRPERPVWWRFREIRVMTWVSGMKRAEARAPFGKLPSIQ